MSKPVDAFLATWANARATFGDGATAGARLDRSAGLRQSQSRVQAATPGSRWTGRAADAYAAANARQARALGELAGLEQRIGAEVGNSGAVVAAGRRDLDAVRQRVLDAASALPQTASGQRMLLSVARSGVADIAGILHRSGSDLDTISGRVRDIGSQYRALGKPTGGEPPDKVNKVWGGFPEDVPGDDDRRRASAEAFQRVFGRPPTSPIDWETADALNPNSYDPDYQGVKPEIRVVRIRPVPGAGLVRTSQWIEQRDVYGWPPGTTDRGDNRVADANFEPGASRVTTYVDYENGIVVMRQNPSVELDDNGGPGHVKVGVPQGSVTQTSDGAVRIKYDAANPFAPEIARHPPEPFENHGVTVNGDLVFTPQPGGVHVDGTRTNYPSMEIYQDLPDGATRTVLIDPAWSGSPEGPVTNLPFHHDVGMGGRAFEPFDTGGWNPRYDVRVPLPSTDFGSVFGPPSVPPLPVGTAVPS